MTNQLFLTVLLELFLPLLPLQLINFYFLHLKHTRYQELGVSFKSLPKAQQQELRQADPTLRRLGLLTVVAPLAFLLMSVLLVVRLGQRHGDKFGADRELATLSIEAIHA